jgi:hypothetical protein
MVYYPPTAKPPLDPQLAAALQEAAKLRPKLTFAPLSGGFVTDHSSNTPVTVTGVTGHLGLRAVVYKTPIHEDDDGDPEAYGSPPDSNHVTPSTGVNMRETSLKNATNQKDPAKVFNDPPTPNTFRWEGVRSRHEPPQADDPAGAIDPRDFLKDVLGRFPIFRSGSNHFYAAQTAMNGPDGQAVNAQEVPYGALSAALRAHGRVGLGDVGLAIRMSTGAACGFLFGDAGGPTSNSVGEYSVKLARTLFGGGHPSSEPLSFIVFPRSATSGVARPELIAPTLRNALVDLANFENVDEVITRLARPQFGEPLFVGRSFVPRFGFRNSLRHALENEDDNMEATIRVALRSAGLP